jgi:hypothetical protein
MQHVIFMPSLFSAPAADNAMRHDTTTPAIRYTLRPFARHDVMSLGCNACPSMPVFVLDLVSILEVAGCFL